MLRNLLFVLVCFSFAGALACSTAQSPGANANTGNAVNIDAANLPPGFSTSPLPLNANIPGITTSGSNGNVSLSNVPGIPNANQLANTAQPKKTPPIPGIPDEETIRRQMNTPLQDVNIVNNPSKSQRPDNRPPDKSRGNTRQP